MKLTDQELTRLAAEKVMGWPIVAATDLADYDGPFPAFCDGAALTGCLRGHEWEPLTDWRAAGELVEKMRADGYGFVVESTDDGIRSSFHDRRYEKNGHMYSESGPRSIVISALKTVGAITREQVC